VLQDEKYPNINIPVFIALNIYVTVVVCFFIFGFIVNSMPALTIGGIILLIGWVPAWVVKRNQNKNNTDILN